MSDSLMDVFYVQFALKLLVKRHVMWGNGAIPNLMSMTINKSTWLVTASIHLFLFILEYYSPFLNVFIVIIMVTPSK